MLETMLSAAAWHSSSQLLLLFVTPFLLRGVGLESYGLWVLLTSFSKYCAIANFGIGPALTKYAAEYVARGEPEKTRQMTTFGMLFYLGIGLLTVPIVIALSPRLVVALHLSPGLAAIAPALFVYFAIFSACGLSSAILSQLLIGLGLFDVSAGIGAASQITFIIVAGVMLIAHFKLMALVVSVTVQMVLSGVLCYVYARGKLGRVFANPFAIRLSAIKPLFKVGGWIQLSSAMVLLLFESQSMMIGLFVGVSAAGLYDVGSKLARGVRALSYYFNTATLPLVSTLEAESGRARAESTFMVSVRYVGLISFSIMGLLIAGAPLVLALWLGKRYGTSPTILLVVTVLGMTYALDNLTGVGITIRRGLGATRLEVVYTATAAVTTILCGLLLVHRFGVAGVVFGTALGTLLGSAAFFNVFTRAHHIQIWNALLSPILRLLASTVLAAGAFWLTQRLIPVSLLGSRMGILVALVLGSASYMLVFALGVGLTRFFGADDLALIQRSVPSRVSRVFRLPLVRAFFAVG
ncbi:MAG TPA: oligosaccharide flippase family protein [Candidatus Acidoferrales bacterium]|nr:oligosaccharide flippase family protein [Candidatus Acidoferrales bacterium]